MVFAVRDEMKDAYPELVESAERVSRSSKAEETRFARTVDRWALKKLDEPAALRPDLAENSKDMQDRTLRLSENERRDQSAIPPHLSGQEAFKLYDTFGLPRDFIEDATA